MTDEELLEHLVGTWRVTGEVRGNALSQVVRGQRALGDTFVELRISHGLPLVDGRPYEAVYYIGVASPGRFVLNLMDVFGAAYSPIPGLGERDGDDVVFTFAYSGGPWTWRWHLDGGAWDMTQDFVENGEPQHFATKRMEREVERK